MQSLLLASALVWLMPFTNAQQTQEVTVYWGFGEERPLAQYCTPDQGIDNLIIGSTTPMTSGGWAGAFGSSCYINPDDSFAADCSTVAQDISTCQAAGKKIFLGFSSGTGDEWAIDGEAGATNIATHLWKTYGGDTSDTSTRPFGTVKVDGFDIDVENNPHNQSQAYLGTMVNSLRDQFDLDPSKSYYISGAPECAIPDENMGIAMMEATFDYVWPQFYNGGCSAGDLVGNPEDNPIDIGTYNFESWPQYLASGMSAGASLYVGLSASESGATPYDWVPSQKLPTVVNASSGAAGIMLWNTAHSDATVYDGCTYAQNVASLFKTGSIC